MRRPLTFAVVTTAMLAVGPASAAQPDGGAADIRLAEIAGAPSAARVEADVRRLAAFGTRHTLSDTSSAIRGIGAARRWLFDEFTRISAGCAGCLEVFYVAEVVAGDPEGRLPRDTRVVNVVAVQRGRADPGRFVLMTAHYDSRASDIMDAESDAPGANDDASGVAGVLEAARVLSRYAFDGSIAYAALAGEEQGLYGGHILARHATANGWRVEGVLNNDIIGNVTGASGAASDAVVRVFGPGIPATTSERDLRRLLTTGGELDTPSRQLMRYVDRIADRYHPDLDVMMIYRLDRYRRGGDHAAFFDAGFPAVRFTELYEDWSRQHQDLRVEDGIAYGDVPDAVDFAYAARIIALNATTLASLAWAPAAPDSVTISGATTPNTTLRWAAGRAGDLAGYRVYWRAPTAPQWEHSRWVADATDVTLEGVIIDNHFFGVVAVDRDGYESRAVFPQPGQ